MAYRVLVVDDSQLFVRELTKLIEQDPELKVIGHAGNGIQAIEQVKTLRPDVISLDLNMPILDGLKALDRIMKENPTPVVIVSSLTTEGAEETLDALNKGAFDYILKPGGGDPEQIKHYGGMIRAKLLSAAKNGTKALLKKVASRPMTPTGPLMPRIGRDRLPEYGQVVGIGVSTGGPKTLMNMLPQLPADYPGCVLIAQHMPANFTLSFAQRLDQICKLKVTEAKEGDLIEKGRIFIAPGGMNMTIRPFLGRYQIHLVPEDSTDVYVPSVERLFASLNECLHNAWIGIMLTGMGGDGAKELTRLYQNQGHTLVEAEESCVVFGMPHRVIELGGAEFVLKEEEIIGKLIELTGRPQ